MTLLILSFLSKNRLALLKSKLIHLFLILVAMLISSSASPQVVADFTTISVNTGCGSLVVEFQDLSTGAPNTWLWDFGNGNSSSLQNPTVIYANSGIYDVTLISSNSFTNDSKVSNGLIKVYDNPIAGISINSPINGCMPLMVDFEDISITNNSIVNWQWDFGDGGSSYFQNPIYDYSNDGNFSVSLLVTDINGCQSLSTQLNLIDVYELPVASFIADIPFSCNATELVSFTNNTLGSTNFYWIFGDGSTSNLANPTHNYVAGVYSVSLLAKLGTCIDTLVKTNYIEVGSELYSDFITDINSGCQEMEVNFTDITTNSPDTWIWDFGDGSTSNLQNPTHNFLISGDFDITLTTSKGGQCIDTQIFYSAIQVYANPNVQITADTTYGCSSPFNVEFSDATINAVSWYWDFGNGTNSILQNPSASFFNYGSYDISLIVTNIKGCVDIKLFNDFIEVEKITIDISASELNGCAPFDIDFLDITNSIRPIIDWSWSFGDGGFSNTQNPIHQYSSTGLFDISLFVTNDYGCVANEIFLDFIKVYELPHADFQASQLVSCPGGNIDFSDLTVSGSQLTNWFWDFGDGNISNLQNPIFQYQLTGIYDVTLIAASNNCIDTFKILNYIDIIEPTAIFSENYSCDNPLQVKFENLSIGADNIFWDFGDGNTSIQINPIHNYAMKGDYNVSLKVSNNITGCTHKSIKPIKLTIPEANFDYLINPNNGYEDSVVCIPKRVYLNNTSQDMSYYKVLWSDGYVGYGRIDHLIINTGQLDVTMIITDIHGCNDTTTHQNMYRVTDLEADFGIVNVLGCDSMLVDFEDLSSPASSVIWNFGDGGSSIINNPQHIYYAEGYYDVTLYAQSVDGCKDTMERLEYIQFQYPTADFISNIQGICPNDQVQFSNISDGIGISSDWDFGDGSQSVQINPSHSFTTNGLYDISLLITDSFNCTSNMVLVNHIEVLKPTADFITAGISSNCPPLISNFSNSSSTDVVNWEWIFSGGGSSFLANPSHLFLVSGTFDVTLIVENSFGCKDTLVQNELVNIAGPIGSFSISDSLICKDDSILFIPLVMNTDNFLWDFGNGILSTDSFPSIVYTADGIFMPSLIIENTSGCQFTINNSDTIKVRSVNIDAGNDVEICEGGQVQLNALGNSTLFAWIPTLALNDPNLFNPIASPLNDIMYFIHHSDGMCEATDSVFVKVYNEVPIPTFTTLNHCEGDTIYFNGNSGLLTPNIGWEWSFGSSIQNPLQQLAFGVNTIQLIAVNLDNNCSDTLVQQVEIYPLPIAHFTANEVCLGEPSNFINNSSANVVNWEYIMADGLGVSSLQNPNYTYSNSGTFYPSLVVSSNFGCISEYTSKVEVNELPFANFLVENNCIGEENIFSDISTISNGMISNWEYIFGDGTTNGVSSIEQHKYALAATYNVTLNVITDKGCESSVVKETKVFDNPIIDFISDQFCLGTPTSFTDFSTLNNGNIVQWEWAFGDGVGVANFEHPTYRFTSPGNYSVNLIATTDFGCTSSMAKIITIFALPTANFTNDATACLGDDIHFTDLSMNNNIASWEWNLGDGTIFNIQNPAHTYNYVSSFDISLEVISLEGCKHDTTIINAVEVFNNPIADFNASAFTTTELFSEIEFYNNSTGAILYEWDFDNGSISTERNPIVDFQNIKNHEVVLHVVSAEGCESEIMKNINISPEFTLYAPNAFTPNGDGNNDVFLAKGNGVTSFEMQVFDRWGGIVFESSDIEYGWDGLDVSANKAGIGTYMYHISLYDYNGKLWVYNGELNLMR
ncbi:MAG: PKD domain-containing protein [Cryomorphaceae bacterium]|nr:PKD domain-containing protein [Cryomorphaceae bacterium]